MFLAKKTFWLADEHPFNINQSAGGESSRIYIQFVERVYFLIFSLSTDLRLKTCQQCKYIGSDFFLGGHNCWAEHLRNCAMDTGVDHILKLQC